MLAVIIVVVVVLVVVIILASRKHRRRGRSFKRGRVQPCGKNSGGKNSCGENSCGENSCGKNSFIPMPYLPSSTCAPCTSFTPASSTCPLPTPSCFPPSFCTNFPPPCTTSLTSCTTSNGSITAFIRPLFIVTGVSTVKLGQLLTQLAGPSNPVSVQSFVLIQNVPDLIEVRFTVGPPDSNCVSAGSTAPNVLQQESLTRQYLTQLAIPYTETVVVETYGFPHATQGVLLKLFSALISSPPLIIVLGAWIGEGPGGDNCTSIMFQTSATDAARAASLLRQIQF